MSSALENLQSNRNPTSQGGKLLFYIDIHRVSTKALIGDTFYS
jgi:hypothetical protein